MKKNWRNKVAMGLSAVMVMGALVGCGGGESKETTKAADETGETTAETTAEAARRRCRRSLSRQYINIIFHRVG